MLGSCASTLSCRDTSTIESVTALLNVSLNRIGTQMNDVQKECHPGDARSSNRMLQPTVERRKPSSAEGGAPSRRGPVRGLRSCKLLIVSLPFVVCVFQRSVAQRHLPRCDRRRENGGVPRNNDLTRSVCLSASRLQHSILGAQSTWFNLLI